MTTTIAVVVGCDLALRLLGFAIVRSSTYALLVGLQCWQDLLDSAFYENTTDETKALSVTIQRSDRIYDKSIVL